MTIFRVASVTSLAVTALAVVWPHPAILARAEVGESVVLPAPLMGECVHVVATHGTCGLCAQVLMQREHVLWLTQQAHGNDVFFQPLVVSKQAWDALGIAGIPVEFVLDRGKILYVGSPLRDQELPACIGEQRGE